MRQHVSAVNSCRGGEDASEIKLSRRGMPCFQRARGRPDSNSGNARKLAPNYIASVKAAPARRSAQRIDGVFQINPYGIKSRMSASSIHAVQTTVSPAP